MGACYPLKYSLPSAFYPCLPESQADLLSRGFQRIQNAVACLCALALCGLPSAKSSPVFTLSPPSVHLGARFTHSFKVSWVQGKDRTPATTLHPPNPTGVPPAASSFRDKARSPAA